uniref:ATP synthase complex subunit 8 n=1 Tax=Paratrypauchen microcephalus TaxID=1054630 RepID=A0A8E5NPX6_9GOBI|nr:ATP synthase F0 subunit 8 [Paratrypauchen microcephalus]
MPQLDPAPWFALLVFSWLIFTTIAMPKTLNYVFPNEPALQTTETDKTNHWTWSW